MVGWVLVSALFACGDPGPSHTEPPAPDTGVDTGPPPSTDTDTGVPVTDTAPTDTAPTETAVPCPLPANPTSWTYMEGVPVSEDFAFDELGNMVNIDQGPDALFRTPYGGPPELLAPYESPEVAGVTFLLDGRLALADEGNGALVLLGLDGSYEVINGSVNQPNSITIDDQGFIYVTAFDQIKRVDPVTGTATNLLTVAGADLDGLAFSPDFRTLWFNYDEDSMVGKLELDAYGNVLGSKMVMDLPEFGFGELDGMTVDECGNVYAIATNGTLFRVLADGSKGEVLLHLSGPDVMTTSSVRFGSGIGGWESDHLYVMNRYGGIFEIDVGIDGRVEPYLAP